MATRQHSSNGKQKSPRIQVVLPEELCARLNDLAQEESRTVSNMAKVLIQEGVKKYESKKLKDSQQTAHIENTQEFISSLENQKQKRLKGAPRKIKFFKN